MYHSATKPGLENGLEKPRLFRFFKKVKNLKSTNFIIIIVTAEDFSTFR